MRPFPRLLAVVSVCTLAACGDDEPRKAWSENVGASDDGGVPPESASPAIDGPGRGKPPGYSPPSLLPADYFPPSLLALTPEQELEVFKRIEDTYVTTTAARGANVFPIPTSTRPIAPTITWRGKTYDDVELFMRESRMTGLLVIKSGEIVLEHYALGRAQADRWTSFSVGKSITSLLLGAALQDGYITGLDDAVTTYIPDLAGSAYEGVTVRQLITMTSGVKWNENYTDPNSDVVRSSFWPAEPGINQLVSYMRTLPREAEPGTVFNYKTGETDMAGILVANATGRGLAQYLSEKIWAPFGMERDAIWIVDASSVERGGCCISMTLRDYGRIGLFMLSDGMAAGKRVVPEGYVAEATSNQIKPPATGSYGYFWWVDGDGSYAARGIFGQTIQVLPQDALVIVINSAWPSAIGDEYVQAMTAVTAAVPKVRCPGASATRSSAWRASFPSRGRSSTRGACRCPASSPTRP